MAQNTLEIVAKVRADTAEASRQLQQLMQQFKGFKLTDSGLTSQIERSFAKLDKAIANTNQTADQIAGGKATVAQLNAMTKASEQTRKAFSELQQALARVGSKQLDVDLNSQEILDARKLATSAEQAVKRAQEKLKTSLEGLSLPSKINNKLFSSLLNAVDSGDVNKIKATYDKLGNELVTKIKDINNKIAEEESKRTANKTKYESQQSSLNSITEEIKKYQEAEKELNKFSFKSFSESLTSITKGTGIVKLKTSLNAVNESFGNIGKGGSIETAIQALQRLQQQYNSMSMPPQMSIEQWTQLGTAINSALSESGNITQYVQKLNDAKQSLENLTKGLSTNFTQDFTNKVTGLIKNGKIDELSTTIAEKLASVQSQLSKVGDGTDTSGLKAQATALKDFQDALNNLINTGSLDALRQLQKTWADAQTNVGNKENNAIQEALRQFLNLRGAVDGAADAYRGASMASDAATDSIVRQKQELGQVISRFAYFGTAAGIVRTFSRVVRSAFQSVKELDEAMNNIAVVTDYTTKDLWNQIDAYTAMAQATGSTIKGSYEVAQLYYQQGLTDEEVLAASTETLKMARISNIDYAAATDYATAAVKGFGLAYQDLTHINDVYSNLAAKTAASTEEISIAMSKVASIAHSTGMGLETTAAFLTQIIATTREAPETAGTALKTVIARFAEVKKLISEGELTGTDEEGTEINVNNIETALKTAGVALRDTTGQMRNLDDVFIELASRWDSLDTMQQRYIATQAAGSRQQSRFLAMMNDYAGLQETLGYAMNSEGASQEQFNKTLDSLQSKLNNLSNAWTEFTTGIMNSDFIKGGVDILTKILNVINDITGALGSGGSTISKTLLTFGALRYGTGMAGSLLRGLGVQNNLPTIADQWNTGFIGRMIGAVQMSKQGFTPMSDITKMNKIAGLQQNIQTWKTSLGKLDPASDAAAIAALTRQIDGANASITKLSGSLKGTSNSFLRALGPGGTIALAAAVIGIIVTALDKFIVTSKEAQNVWKGTASKVEDGLDKIANQKSIIETLDTLEEGYVAFDKFGNKIEDSSKTFEELLSGVDSYGNNVSLSAEEYASFQDISAQLVGIFPDLKEGYDNVTSAIANQRAELSGLLEEKRNELKLNQQNAAKEAAKEYFTATGIGEDNKLRVTQKNFDDKISKRSLAEQNLSLYPSNGYLWLQDISKELEITSEIDEATGLTIFALEDIMAKRYTIQEKLKEYNMTVLGDNADIAAEEAKATMDELAQQLSTAQDDIKKYDQEIAEMQKTHHKAFLMQAQSRDEWYELDQDIQSLITNVINNSSAFDLKPNQDYKDYLKQQTDINNMISSFAEIDMSQIISSGQLKGFSLSSVVELLLKPDLSKFDTYSEWYSFYEAAVRQIFQAMIDALNSTTLDDQAKETLKNTIEGIFGAGSISYNASTKTYSMAGGFSTSQAPAFSKNAPAPIFSQSDIVKDWGSAYSSQNGITKGNAETVIAGILNGLDPGVTSKILTDYMAGSLSIDWSKISSEQDLKDYLNGIYKNYTTEVQENLSNILQKGIDAGLNEDEINTYIDYLQKIGDEELRINRALAARVAIESMLYDKAKESVSSNYDSWVEAYDGRELNKNAWAQAESQAITAMAGLLTVDVSELPEDLALTKENLDDIKLAAEEDVEAMGRLAKTFTKVKLNKLNEKFKDFKVEIDTEKASQQMDDFYNEYGEKLQHIPVGTDIMAEGVEGLDDVREGLTEAIQGAVIDGMAPEQIEGMAQSMADAAGFEDVGWEVQEVSLSEYQQYPGFKIPISTMLEDGKKVQGFYSSEGDSSTAVKSVQMLVPKGGKLKYTQGGSSGKKPSGGGGGGSSKPTKPKQDPFYNYIKTVDDYKKHLESLQDVQEILTKPIDIFNNTKAQEDYYKTLLGSNQSYLNHVNSELERLQKEAQSKYSKYIEVSIDGSLRLTEEYWASTGEITEELDEWIDAYDDVLGRQKDLTDEINDYKKELKDLWEGWRDGFIDLTNDIADVFQELDEKQLEDRQEFYEKLEEQDQRYLESVRNNIEEERKARERANSFEDLQKKQSRLALLQRDSSGRYANDIAELQEEINQDQQDLADENVDNILDTLERQMDKDAERHQDILDAMQKQIDSNVENRIYIERAEQTIAQGEQAILDAIHMGEDWRNASNAEREKMDEEQATNIAGSKNYLEKLNEGITSSSEYISKMVTDALTKQTESLIWTIGDIPQNDEVHVAHAMETTLPPILEQFFARTTTAQDMADNNANSGAKKYASGGLVDYTGPAWVDGTPGKPEAFLNANQTAMIAAFTANLAKMVSGKFPSSNIEAGSNCEINIDIGSIGADYDIDQAINKVKQEIINSAQFRNVTLLNRRR